MMLHAIETKLKHCCLLFTLYIGLVACKEAPLPGAVLQENTDTAHKVIEMLRKDIPLTDSRSLTLQFVSPDGIGDFNAPYKINIIEDETTIQTIAVEQEGYLGPSHYPPVWESIKCSSADYNFDGYMDFRAYIGMDTNKYDPYIYQYFCWNSDTSLYEAWGSSNDYINTDSYPDASKKEIINLSDGEDDGTILTRYWSKWEDKKLYPIEKIDIALVDGQKEASLQEVKKRVKISRRTNGKLRVVDEYNQPDFDRDEKLLQTQRVFLSPEEALDIHFYGYIADANHAGVATIEVRSEYSHLDQLIAADYSSTAYYPILFQSAKPFSASSDKIVQMQDYNFDGYIDFGVVMWSSYTGASLGYVYYFWNPDTNRFENFQNEKGYLNADSVLYPDTKQIETEILDVNSLEEYKKCTFKWVDGELQKVAGDS